MKSFKPGDRVVVDRSYHWAQGATGSIDNPPEAVVAISRDWDGHTRRVKGVRGMMLFHWVTFDVPQRDADGDGPYGAGEVPADFLLTAEDGGDA